MSEQIKAWIDNGSITTSELKEIQKLADERKENGKDYCPYQKSDENKKTFCGITARKCYKTEGYIECSEFQEWFTEELGAKFEDLLPVGSPF
jgi:hypothetical protein